jgi:AcrR family transcriptional regulator
MNAPPRHREAGPHGGSARLGDESGRTCAADLVGFAETLLREAVGGPVRTVAMSLHLLSGEAPGRARGEAVRLSAAEPVWRVSIAAESGLPLAEITLTLADPPAPPPALAPLDRAPAERASADRTPAGPDERRARIARAARDVFAERGYATATIREIAAAAGMHVPTMYQHVRSKTEILELVYTWTIGQAVAGMDQVLSAPLPPVEKVEAIVRQLHAVNNELRRGTLVMNRETRELSRDARERVLAPYAAMVRRIGTVIAEGQAQGLFRHIDPDLAAVFIDALADVWVLRPFAVGHLDDSAYAADLAAFVRGALSLPAAQSPAPPDTTDPAGE